MRRTYSTILSNWACVCVLLVAIASEATAQSGPGDLDPWAAASGSEWEQVVLQSFEALQGMHPDDAAWLPVVRKVPAEQRRSWLKERLNEWMNTEAFVRVQASHWIKDRCHPSEPFVFDDHWSIDLHDAWVQDAIRRNIPFLRFQQLQIAGDVMPPLATEIASGIEHRVATATLWRAHPQQPFFAQKPHEVPTILQGSSDPSLGSVPTQLRWDRLKAIPWLLTQETPSQGQRMLDGERAFDSVRMSETIDWKRIVFGNDTLYWHRREGKFPVPDPNNLVWQLATMSDDALKTTPEKAYERFEFPTSLSSHEPWTIVIEMEMPEADPSSKEMSPATLVEWIGDPSVELEGKSRFAVVWEKQRWVLVWDHAPPCSRMMLEVPITDEAKGACVMAICYDGIPTADAVRVWIDGAYRPFKVREDRLLGGFVSGHRQVFRVARSIDHATTNSIDAPVVEDVACYRTTLTEAELAGRWAEPEWKPWEECTEREHSMWYEHYARRHDSQWKYQRESLQYYAANLSSLYQQIPKVPIAPSQGRIVVDRNLLPREAWNEEGLLPEERLRLANELEVRFSFSLARREIERQWVRMRPSEHPNVDLPEPVHLERIDQWIRHGWDRRWLIESLLLSDTWLRIAIDSED